MRKALSNITAIYVVVMIVGFPLFMTDAYYDILNDKVVFTIVSTICLAGFSLIALLVSYIAAPRYRKKQELKDFIGSTRRAVGLPFIFAFLFLIVASLSTIFSEWTYEAFWGNVGRNQGLYLLIFYFIGFAMTALFYEPKRLHIELFILAGLIVSIWGILDYFYLSPIGWQNTVEAYEKLDFSSGIGNINGLTAVEGIYLLTSAAMWVREEDRKKSVFYFLTVIVHVTALIVGYSDNAIISIGVSLAFLPFYAFKDKRGLIRYFSLYPAYALALLTVGILAVKEPGPHYDMRYFREGILYDFARFHTAYCLLILIGALLLFAAVLLALRKAPESLPCTGFKKAFGGVLLLIALIGLYILYDANIAGHGERYGTLGNLLVFNDDWGTYRGYNWKLALKYMSGFSPLKLLIGSGPETYALYTYSYDYYNIVDYIGLIFDSPHNEWLQILFTTGILGFVTYYGMFLSTILGGFKSKHEAAGALSLGVLAYLLVSFVNISMPNMTVIALTALGITAAYIRGDKTS